MNKWFICLILCSLVSQKPLIYDFNARIISYNNYIIIKINGQGEKQIFGINYFANSYPSPDAIEINGIKQNSNNDYSYCLNETENFAKLEWNNQIDNCNCMFCYCSEIYEIDLSSFSNLYDVLWMYIINFIKFNNF